MGVEAMKHPSLQSMIITIFWIVYIVAVGYVLYGSLPPLNRELLLILGAAAVVPVAATLALLHYARSKRALDDGTS
jgi:hypothetical protein